MRTIVHYQIVPSSQGECVIMATDQAIIWASTPHGSVEDGKKWLQKHISKDIEVIEGQNSILKKAKKELTDYFSGKKVIFSGPFHFEGTAFQKAVWQEMLRIPYGQTISYKEMATRVGNPKAPRAVGGACRNNPIAVLVPCHRILGSNKALTGYAGKTGIPTKQWLLTLESRSPLKK